MKKTIWILLVLGTILGILDLVSLAVDFLFPLGPFGATGPQEIFVTISAALGGPVGLFATSFFQELGVYLFFLITPLFSEQISSTMVVFTLADFAAHILALLVVAYGRRFLHQHAKKERVFLAGWILIVVFYYIVLVLLQALLLGFVIPGAAPLSILFQNNLPEFSVVIIISTLIWIALPKRYRPPLWIELQPAAKIIEDTASAWRIFA